MLFQEGFVIMTPIASIMDTYALLNFLLVVGVTEFAGDNGSVLLRASSC